MSLNDGICEKCNCCKLWVDQISYLWKEGPFDVRELSAGTGIRVDKDYWTHKEKMKAVNHMIEDMAKLLRSHG